MVTITWSFWRPIALEPHYFYGSYVYSWKLLPSPSFTFSTRENYRVGSAISTAWRVVVGLYFIGIIAYLLVNAVMPITQAGEWRTIIDVIAVSTYLIGGIPMVLISLQDLGVTHKDASEEKKLGLPCDLCRSFLVFARSNDRQHRSTLPYSVIRARPHT